MGLHGLLQGSPSFYLTQTDEQTRNDTHAHTDKVIS
jgi:hypothetical protein